MKSGKKKTEESRDEVEELLQSAQDELLLKLSLNSHMSRVSPDYLHPDLDRRFQALRFRPKSSNPNPNPQSQLQTSSSSSSSSTAPKDEQDLKAGLGDDDLSARFAALKSSLISSSSSSSSATEALVGPKLSDGRDLHDDDEDEDEDDEVEKVIQWAIDAARLDPSPASDDDDDDDDDGDAGDDSDKDSNDEEDDEVKKKGK